MIFDYVWVMHIIILLFHEQDRFFLISYVVKYTYTVSVFVHRMFVLEY